MSNDPKRIDLSIYLLKQGVDYTDAINDSDFKKKLSLALKGSSKSLLYIRKNLTKRPAWAQLFEHTVNSKEFGENASTGCLLIIALNSGHQFIISFGSGFQSIDSEAIREEFGLRTLLNVLDEKSIRSIDKSSLESQPKQLREQTGTATEIQYFGLNVERDLLRAITGIPKDKGLGKRITGKDSIRVSTNIELESIPALLRKLLDSFQDNAYKQGPFNWIDHIKLVRNKERISKLNALLVELFNSNSPKCIWLSVPEIVDWNRITDFKYSASKNSILHHDIDIESFKKSLGKKKLPVDLNTLKSRNIYAIDGQGDTVYAKSVYRHIYAEVSTGKAISIINNGNWYDVKDSYATEIENYYKGIAKYPKNLPIYNDETEGAYNKRVSSENNSEFALLDMKNIRISGTASPVEPCDLYRKDHEFIHVKRYSGSSTLSHLFNQGVVSGELFQMSEEFRKALNSKLPTLFKVTNTNHRPKTNQYSVVYAIVSEYAEELNLPFFSKVALKIAHNHLKAIGYKVYLAKIEVDEVKSKLKKCPPSKHK